jgi:hypothetical protein
MRDALNATGRPVLFALCGWFPWYASDTFSAIGNMRRIGLDSNNWAAVLSNVDTNANLAAHAKPGAFNDPCLLISKNAAGAALATELQTRAQFSMWAMMASPLLISGNVRNISAFDLATYSNAAVIRVNQDVLGKQGIRLVGGPFTNLAYLSTCDATDPSQQFERGSAANGTDGRRIVARPAAAESGAGSPAMPACAFSAAKKHSYLFGCAKSSSAAALNVTTDGDCPGEVSLTKAEAACLVLGRACGGITLQDSSWQPRAANVAAPAPASRDSTSWVITNQEACRGPLSPPPPPAVCFMARGCQSDPTFAPCHASQSPPTCGGNATVPHPDQSYSLDPHTAQLKSYALSALTNRLEEQPKCMQVSVFPYLILKPCAPGSAEGATVPTMQQWAFDEQQIMHRGSGACLTRGGLSTTNVWGRQLHNGDYALLFVNTGPVAMDVACGTACWAVAGLAGDGKTFAVRDLWQNRSAGTLTTAKTFIIPDLEPDGGVAMFRLSPQAE